VPHLRCMTRKPGPWVFRCRMPGSQGVTGPARLGRSMRIRGIVNPQRPGRREPTRSGAAAIHAVGAGWRDRRVGRERGGRACGLRDERPAAIALLHPPIVACQSGPGIRNTRGARRVAVRPTATTRQPWPAPLGRNPDACAPRSRPTQRWLHGSPRPRPAFSSVPARLRLRTFSRVIDPRMPGACHNASLRPISRNGASHRITRHPERGGT